MCKSWTALTTFLTELGYLTEDVFSVVTSNEMKGKKYNL